ncbi:MAG: acetyl-CoA C-acyltransferase [Balneolaceae bacterium]
MNTHTTTFKEAVFVDGGRIPFQRAGSGYRNLMAYDLGRLALRGLLTKTALPAAEIDRVILGNVIQEVNTSNIARESALGAGIPDTVPAFTVTMACISSNLAVTTAMEQIRTGQSRVVIAGGVDLMSDIPIRFRRKFRKKLLETQKYRSFTDYLGFFKGLRPSDLLPEIPSIAEFSTGETMGESCDKMAAKYGITREEQDRYALRSHRLAAEAAEKDLLAGELFPASIPSEKVLVEEDNVIRGDSTLEKLASLRPAFVKPHGTVTAGNASALTDGASAALITEAGWARENGYTPKARLCSYTYVARQPGDELLIGPAFAVPKVLDEMNLTIEEIDVFEFHEAFAGQMLTVLKALGSDSFAKERLGRTRRVGEIPLEKLNTRGGSLSLGHPFGATGTRLVTTAANRLQEEDGTYALVAACAAGGQGHAIILERI